MVTRTDVHELLHLIDDLSSLNMECRNLPDMKIQSRINVKNLGGVIDWLEDILDSIEDTSTEIKKIDGVKSAIKRWIKNLEKNYGEEKVGDLPFYLKVEDAKSLDRETTEWIDTIIESFANKGTSIIKEDSATKLISDDLSIKLDDDARKDLRDGVDVLLHQFPTPATMILLRVAERVIREFYKKTTGNEPGNKTWGKMLEELEGTGKVKKPLMGYLYHLNEKRISSAHPYRRFSQEEAERILLQIKDLMEEIL